jgi:arylesterase/paraoxonase
MKHARRLLIAGALSVVAGVTILVLHTLWVAGVFKTIEPHGTDDCRVIEGFSGGTEDFIARPDGTLWVSSPNFRDAAKGGRIYLVDVDTGSLTDVTPSLDFPFQPHGVGLWVDSEGERLFVVNHRGGSALPDVAGGDAVSVLHTIEMFDVQPDNSLRHVSSVRGDRLIAPNDVTAVSRDAFYFTNDHGYATGIMRTLEDYLRIPAGDVVYGDANGLRTVWKGARYANGIVATPDGKTLYVAETTGLQIRRFARDAATGDLTLEATYELGTGLDNLNLDGEGNLWTGAHPKLLTFQEHAHDPSVDSPSQVLRITPDGEEFHVHEEWLSDGSVMSGSSVAYHDGERTIVGAVFEGKLVVCAAE